MKKCRFCVHRGHTERGEEVCAKFLLCIEDDKEELPCKGYEMTVDAKHIAVAIVAALIGLMLIFSTL